MVRTTDVYPSASGFLRAADLTQDTEFVIEGYEIRSFKPNPKFSRNNDERQAVVLQLAGSEQSFRLNQTNMRVIEKAYGEEMDDWIGKSIIIYPDTWTSPRDGEIPTLRVRIDRPVVKAATKKATHPQYTEINPPPADDDGGY